MAGCACYIPMSSVGEVHIKALQGREGLYLGASRFHVGVANGADRAAVCGKLLRMTTSARGVLQRPNGPGPGALAAMAQQARQPLMTLIAM
jgi:hypothetical protein